jgi:integrase
VIGPMPRPRPPHLQREVTRHGKVVWFVRVGKGPRIRIRETYGTPEFQGAYQAAVSGTPRPAGKNAAKGSLGWLVAQYRGSSAWTALASATRRQRENIFKHVLETAGAEPANHVTAKSIKAGIERRKDTPSQARNFLDAMRGLFEWAAGAEHVPHDPTAGVKAPARPKTDGFIPWTEEHVARYQKRWPLGTRQRVWLDVLLYSGLRRGDAVRYGRPHVRNGVGRIKTEKSGHTVTAIVPVLPVLQETLDAGPVGDLTFIVGANGKPLTKESFGNEFRAACRAAGVPGSAHGVRKIAATTAANNGATVAQLKALFGWTDDAMPALYTRTADRERLAIDAAHTLANEERTSMPAPRDKVRAIAQKSKSKQGLGK